MIELPPPLWIPPRPAIIRPADARIIAREARRINKASFLPGMFPAGIIAKKSGSLSFVGTVADDSNLTTYSFATAGIGAADATRRTVVACHWYSTGTGAVTMSSATIGGVAATIHVQASPAGTTVSPGCAIISLLNPTGTTSTIAFTLSTTAARAFIGIYRAVDESVASPFATVSDGTLSSNALDVSLNTPAGWVMAAASISSASAGQTFTWVGVGENYDTFSAENTSRYYTGGHNTSITPSTPRTITVTDSGAAVDGVGVSMSWN